MQTELLKHLEFLTAIRPFKNWMNLESLKVASDYIDREFKSYKLNVSHQKWNVGTNEYVNVIAAYKPELKKRLIVGAHYDIYDKQPGADDNTSGVAGLLYMAKSIAENQPDLPYGIDFVAFCLEEPPNFGTKNMGSYVHAKSLNDNKTDVVGMVCLDMIGYFSDAPDSQKYPSVALSKNLPTVGNFIAVIGHTSHANFSNQIYQLMKEKGGIDTHLINFPSSDGLAGLSDHRNYWHFGYDALMINDTAKFRNPNYHKITDTVETLNMEKMGAVVQAVLYAISSPLKQSAPKPPKQDKEPETNLEPKTDKLSFLTRFFMWLRNLFSKK